MPFATQLKTQADLFDWIAINNAISSYASGIDRQERDVYRSIFTDTLDLSFPEWLGVPTSELSADDWGDLVATTIAGFDATNHIITNRVIELDGDRAVVSAHLLAIHSLATDGRPELHKLGGYYTYCLVRVASDWKIASVTLDVVWDEGDRTLFARAYERGMALSK